MLLKLPAWLDKPWIKIASTAFIIPLLGFVLLNIAFMSDYFFQTALDALVGLFKPVDNAAWSWYPPLKHTLFMIILSLVTRFVFKSKLKTLFKAIFLTVPLAAIYLTIGMTLYPWPIISFMVAGIFCIGNFYLLYRTKQPWQYFWASICINLAMLIGSLLGMDI